MDGLKMASYKPKHVATPEFHNYIIWVVFDTFVILSARYTNKTGLQLWRM
jgi:hypothetical protein